jgi:TPR repeat protein
MWRTRLTSILTASVFALALGGCLRIDWNDLWRLPEWAKWSSTTPPPEQAAPAPAQPIAVANALAPAPSPPPAPSAQQSAQPSEPVMPKAEGMAAHPTSPAATTAMATAAGPAVPAPPAVPASPYAVQHGMPWPLGYALRKVALSPDNAATVLRDRGLRGDGYAIAALAYVHDRGLGSESHPAIAAMWLGVLKEHANAGNASAQTALGIAYRYGYVQPRDLVEARRWLAKAEAQKDPMASVELGLMARDGVGEAANAEKAATLFKRAAERGSAPGTVELARAIELGQAATANPARAARLYDWAGRQGYGAGDYRLALLHREGKGVRQDLVEALARFTVAERTATEAPIHEAAAKAVADLRGALSPAQLAEAETRAEILLPR